MNWIRYITQYWAQVTILIGAVGYVLKVILDYKFKEKEIWHTAYTQKKIEQILKYCALYYKIESNTLGIMSVYATVGATSSLEYEELDTLTLANSYKELGQLLNQLRFFIGKTQFDIIHDQHLKIGIRIQALNNLLIKRADENPLKEEFEKLYQETLNIIRVYSAKVFSLKM